MMTKNITYYFTYFIPQNFFNNTGSVFSSSLKSLLLYSIGLYRYFIPIFFKDSFFIDRPLTAISVIASCYAQNLQISSKL